MSATMASAVLFDLDGTLVDSAGDLAAAANALRAGRGWAPVSVAQVRPAISAGALAILAAALPECDEAERAALQVPYLAAYRERIGCFGGLFPGVAQVLEAVEVAGSRWGVVTNKREDLARRVLERLDLASRCAVLIGGDTLPRCKPDPLPVEEACARIGVAPHAAVFIGDDRRDVQAGRAAGARTLAVAWGFHAAGDSPWDWSADAVISEPLDLLLPGTLSARGV